MLLHNHHHQPLHQLVGHQHGGRYHLHRLRQLEVSWVKFCNQPWRLSVILVLITCHTQVFNKLVARLMLFHHRHIMWLDSKMLTQLCLP